MLEIWLYDEVGTGDFTSKALAARLKEIGASTPVVVAINSGGGSAFEGLACYHLLRRHGGKVVVRIDGLAASAASLVAMAGAEVVATRGAYVMLHSPIADLRGNAAELRDTLDVLAGLETEMAEIYARKAKVTIEVAKGWLSRESWFSAQQAVAVGLVDRLEEDLEVAAAIPVGVLRYQNVPAQLRARVEGHDDKAQARKRRRERVLDAARFVPTTRPQTGPAARRARVRARLTITAGLRLDRLRAEARAAPRPPYRGGYGGDPNVPVQVTLT